MVVLEKTRTSCAACHATMTTEDVCQMYFNGVVCWRCFACHHPLHPTMQEHRLACLKCQEQMLRGTHTFACECCCHAYRREPAHVVKVANALIGNL